VLVLLVVPVLQLAELQRLVLVAQAAMLTVAQVLREEHLEVAEALTVAQVLQVARAETCLPVMEAVLKVIQAAQVEIAVTQYSTVAVEDKALTASKLADKA
jgi:hypothetical protein